ncbi:family 10 glycosylhydrolase [Salinimicrobium catena]|uniref:glycoside hydrolase family 10 protein n=1 Tax=Salinimicrobium catena TaxID=390640 RepID=UPI002FE45455
MFPKNPIIISLMIIAFIFSGCFTPKPVVSPEPSIETREVPSEKKEPSNIISEPIPEIKKEDSEEKAFKHSPFVMREFRAAWIATVANINWPSKAGLSSEEQKKEAIALLDFLQEHNYNAVIFQARPQADALYESDLEPWSYFLTGEQGKAPQPYYDPLEFWVEEAHDRGLELHVWLNPYRAHHSSGGKITEAATVKNHPNLVVELKNGMWWMDPSKKETQDHTAAVVMDIVKRYDIDGVHFDDYFYPYASYNKGEDFPDSSNYQAYLQQGGKMERADWRRDNVNRFVERIYKEIKAEKPHVKFGISPFGIYRPGFPQSIQGMDQYNELYADARLWLNKGWIDYYSPQLYWKINQTAQSFPVLLGWWEKENHQQRHLWPGINIDFGGDEPNVIETISQIMITRGMLPESKGSVHWSIGPLLKYPKISAGIRDRAYSRKALIPASPWLDATPPKKPELSVELNNDLVNLSWNHENEFEIFQWVIHYKYKGAWNYRILDRHQKSLTLPRSHSEGENNYLTHIGVTAVDRSGNQSEFVEQKL